MLACPNGHSSSTDDYCDSCGSPLVRTPAARDESPPDWTARSCEVCSAEASGDDVFCESCGYRFGDPVAITPATPCAWEIVITADRGQYDRNAPVAAPFPADAAPRVMKLVDEEIEIGRRSESGGGKRRIDVADPAISHQHAILVRQHDGTYAITDLQSMNGTRINDEAAPLEHQTMRRLEDGDRVFVGAWTMLVIRASSSGDELTTAQGIPAEGEIS